LIRMIVEQSEKIAYLTEQLQSLQANKSIFDLEITNNKAAINRGSLVVASAKIFLNEKKVQIHIGLNNDFPQTLPIIVLEKEFLPENIPHIEYDGFVCYSEQENLVIDSSVPERVLADAIERTIDVLQKGISGENKWDFVDEFDAYWRSYQKTIPVKSLINPSPEVRQIVVARGSHKADKIDIAYLSDNDSTPIEFGIESRTVSHDNGIYVPLQKGTFIDMFTQKNLTAKLVRKTILKGISPSNRKLLKKLTKKFKRNEVVIFGLPRPSGGVVLFGVQFSAVYSAHPLNDDGNAEGITPITLLRLDKSYLLPRGGANASFQNKRIALVGCGAVGGLIAFQLIQSGILDLTLIDHDNFKYENTFRNPLGKQFVGETKVESLRKELESKYPYVKIKTVALKFEEAISKSILDMEKFDLVIMATGDDNVSLMINRLFNAKGIRLPILYSWLEPYGIGGHVLVANLDGKGCFQCLFTPMQPYGEFSNRASFVAPGQAFTKDIAGCANRFTPFGSLDAGNTASLAVRLSLKVLSGKITANALYSWKGEADDLADVGFQVSDRFINFDFADTNNGVKVYNPNCPICGS